MIQKQSALCFFENCNALSPNKRHFFHSSNLDGSNITELAFFGGDSSFKRGSIEVRSPNPSGAFRDFYLNEHPVMPQDNRVEQPVPYDSQHNVE
jgi:hypothetical protein